MSRIKDKVAIVTGGARGIGEATSVLLAKEGAKIAIVDIDKSLGESVATKICNAGGTAKYWEMDTRSENQVQEIFKQIAEEFGHINILVNNAGITGVNKITEAVTEVEWDEVMDTNVKGVFFCTKHVIPHMRKIGGGSIINLSSIYGLVGAPNVPPYHAAKGAVRLMTKTDAVTYAKDKIRVNSVHPGCILTPKIEDRAQNYSDGREAFMSIMNDLHPLGHIGEPNDVAYGILYLASDEAKFVTGSELVIDGGYTAR